MINQKKNIESAGIKNKRKDIVLQSGKTKIILDLFLQKTPVNKSLSTLIRQTKGTMGKINEANEQEISDNVT